MSVARALTAVARLVLAVTPSPTPSPSATGSAATSLGSPGITGFVVTFVLALALIGLFLSLTRHLRIVDRRSRQREEQDAAGAPAPGVDGGADGGVVPPAGDAAGPGAAGHDVGGPDGAGDAAAGSR